MFSMLSRKMREKRLGPQVFGNSSRVFYFQNGMLWLNVQQIKCGKSAARDSC